MMLKGRCLSVTELRTNTKKCLSGLDDSPKYIFVNNKPVAVLIDIDEYEELFGEPELKELRGAEVFSELAEEANAAKKLTRKELVNLK